MFNFAGPIYSSELNWFKARSGKQVAFDQGSMSVQDLLGRMLRLAHVPWPKGQESPGAVAAGCCRKSRCGWASYPVVGGFWKDLKYSRDLERDSSNGLGKACVLQEVEKTCPEVVAHTCSHEKVILAKHISAHHKRKGHACGRSTCGPEASAVLHLVGSCKMLKVWRCETLLNFLDPRAFEAL